MRELTTADLADLTPLVWAIVRRRFATVPETVAAPDDLYQYGIEGAVKAARRFDRTGGTSFTSWTTMAAHRAIQDGLRTLSPGSRKGKALTFVGLADDADDWLAMVADEDMDAGLVRQTLAAAIGRLPARQRETVLLYFAAGLNYREAGERMGITECGAHLNVRGALKKLRADPALAGIG